MARRSRAGLRLAALLGLALLGGGAGEDVAIATVPAFNAAFGQPTGQPRRPVHTKGVVAEGVFIPAPDAAELSRAPHLAGGPVPITMRLSTFAGLPESPDAGPLAAPRGMAIKFRLPDELDTDVVVNSYNGFPAATPAEFLGFLKALADGNGTAAAGQGTLDSFLAAHPAARTFVDAPKPAPPSWSNETFYSVNAFVFVNAAGGRRYGRYRIVPSAGEHRLTDDQAKAAPPDYLSTQLAAELAQGPVSWHLQVQLAAPGDPLDDGSQPWPLARPVVELGLLRLDHMVPAPAADPALSFSPLNLVDGVEGSGDPMLAARSRAYGEAYRLRAPQ